MRILVGVAERGAPELLAELDRIRPLPEDEVWLAHVIDNGMRGEVELRRGHLMPRPLPPHRLRAIGVAEREAARAATEEAAAVAATLAASVQVSIEEGEPGRVLSRLAEVHGCDLVAVAARVDRTDPLAGPHSVGHTARFVLDHSPRPVLLLRGSPQR
ncbi:MAG: universal stress protein [Candidatus Dormibacteraeota bacterium]|nr:universal stress protein [Candidatus Dormibacteraeota bacterium]